MMNNEISEALEMLFRQAQMQFGSAIKSKWFHSEDGCPGCGKAISKLKHKGTDAISLNAFIYREHGVLIAYMLCGKCGKKVINAKTDTPLHSAIEATLKRSYLRKSGH